MDENHIERQAVFRSYTRDQCREARLVLEALGIATDVVHQAGDWQLVVANRDYDVAKRELDAYRRDHAEEALTETNRIPLFGGAVFGGFVYAAILCSFASVSQSSASQPLWHAVGRMGAGEVLEGQWWRIATALTLHVDVGHLLSNLGFGCMFGFLAGRILGGGVAWLAIVVAGSLGNLMNAFMQEASHASVGASTAVFAALGIMVAHALRPRSTVRQKPMKRWSPLIAGVVLLSLIGVGGERTDVGAHVMGFLAGLVIGWFASRLPENVLSNRRVQVVTGSLALCIILAAWTAAIIQASTDNDNSSKTVSLYQHQAFAYE